MSDGGRARNHAAGHGAGAQAAEGDAGISKAGLAELMQTSRARTDRILKAHGNVTIETLQRAASFVGRDLRVELV